MSETFIESEAIKLATQVMVNEHRLRIYVADELEMPWTGYTDLVGLLGLPRSDDILSVLQVESPHSFRRGDDGCTAISYWAASELVDGLGPPAQATAWRDAVRDVWVAACDAPTDFEAMVRMHESYDRSLTIAHEGIQRVRAMASRH